jgi:hypothetical protein
MTLDGILFYFTSAAAIRQHLEVDLNEVTFTKATKERREGRKEG